MAAMAAGEPVYAAKEDIERRRDICQGCEFFNGSQCAKCGCYYSAKIILATEQCPVGKW